MLRVDIITCLPGLIESPFQHSIMKRAIEKGLVALQIHDLRDFSKSKHRSVDDYAFGGGAGMVLSCDPLFNAVEHLQTLRKYDDVIFLTPDGETLNQSMANALSLKGNLIMICGHYKGIDERVRQTLVTKEISIGDYVLSGGELAAAVLCDALFRLIPGVLNDETSALTDSFQDHLLSAPVYTRPADYRGLKVPDVLLSGHEKKIAQWRFQQAIERTTERRPDLLQKTNKDPEEL